MEMTKDMQERLALLEEKYNAMGQDMTSYLDGLLYADYLTYWDYIHLDTLLSLQTPRTYMPDEQIFIMYHQISELYFKLILHECKQIANKEQITEEFLLDKISRIHRYFNILVSSFTIMTDGMDKQQFLKYRTALLPASGFQSVQYRSIEFHFTDIYNLVAKDAKANVSNKDISTCYENLYWKRGATELATGKKTLTLRQFEEKYSKKLVRLAERYQTKNILKKYQQIQAPSEELKNALKAIDTIININWPLSHYKAAVKHLQNDPDTIKATGGTNWQQYLPPRFQRIMFFPELWNPEELEQWGKTWVEDILANK